MQLHKNSFSCKMMNQIFMSSRQYESGSFADCRGIALKTLLNKHENIKGLCILFSALRFFLTLGKFKYFI